MIRMKGILQSINVLNGLLVAAIAVLAFFIAVPLSDHGRSKILPPVKPEVTEVPEKSAAQARQPFIDFALISDQNIFHPERKIPPDKKEEKAIASPEVILYGTLITGLTSIAFVEDRKAPNTTPGRGKRQIALHKGEQLGGYTLTEIATNNIVLTKGEERIVVLLEAGEKRKSSEASLLPASSPMMQGGFQPSTPASAQKVASTASPVQKAAPAASPKPQAILQPAAVETGETPGVMLPSRRNAAQMEVIKRKERARQLQSP